MNIFKKIKLIYCNNFIKKLIGFSFKIKKIEYGKLFFNTNSIQTLFMLQSIDIIMTDKDFNILYLYENVKPFKIIYPKSNVYYTLELPLNFIKNNNLKIGDKINE